MGEAMPQLQAKGVTPYDWTAEDRLWLLRATEAEGAPVQTIPRVLINGFMVARAHNPKLTLTTYVRGYSQPVNPRWFPDGDLFKKNVKKPTKSQLAVATARRDVLSKRMTFLPDVTSAVDQALQYGWSSNATDYAAYNIGASGKKGMTALTPPVKGTNRLWTRSPKWAGYLSDGQAGSVAGNGVMMLALAGLALLVWKSA